LSTKLSRSSQHIFYVKGGMSFEGMFLHNNYTPAPKERGYTVLPSCVCLSVIFCRSFLNNYSSQMLELLAHSFFWHAIWWDSDHFFLTNPRSTFCLSEHLSLECITNFRRSFFSNYPLQMLEILVHSFFRDAMRWD
jgi:hypothetical protein